MRIYLYRGYRSEKMTNGIHYGKGIHELEDGLAQYLIDNGHAESLDVETKQPESKTERDVHITDPAKALMESFDLSIDDFPDTDRITKPMVDAHIANTMFNED